MIVFGGTVFKEDFTTVRGILKVKCYDHHGRLECAAFYKITDNKVLAFFSQESGVVRAVAINMTDWEKLVADWQTDDRMYSITKIV